jgi:hypothetical protein
VARTLSIVQSGPCYNQMKSEFSPNRGVQDAPQLLCFRAALCQAEVTLTLPHGGAVGFTEAAASMAAVSMAAVFMRRFPRRRFHAGGFHRRFPWRRFHAAVSMAAVSWRRFHGGGFHGGGFGVLGCPITIMAGLSVLRLRAAHPSRPDCCSVRELLPL